MTGCREDENGNIVSKDPVAKVMVDRPIELRAVWRTDYTDLAALSLAAALAIAAAVLLGGRSAKRAHTTAGRA